MEIMATYKFIVFDNDDVFEKHNIENTIGDAWEVESTWDCKYPEYIAEEAAEEYFDNHDGWEDNWPLKFAIFSDNNKILGKFEINLESRPHFYIEKHLND